MSAFNGKWVLTGGDNVEAFHDAIKTPEEFKAKMKQLAAMIKEDPQAHIHEITVDKAAGTVRRVMFLKGEKKHDGEIPIGKDHTANTPDGRTVTVHLKMDSDTKISRHEKGDGWEADGTFEVNGDEMTLSQSCGSVKCWQKFKRL